eukprot:TRINITY_DN5178_c0_g1_i1.p1 TRINITY_DN5178_c0_g1~~TRINITY_DN5178_c0_g1_i1.p1  ORF type:complete len:1271 (-),score=310.77 TRINITY_DN5178_c0_g1_i1:14-3298(-)
MRAEDGAPLSGEPRAKDVYAIAAGDVVSRHLQDDSVAITLQGLRIVMMSVASENYTRHMLHETKKKIKAGGKRPTQNHSAEAEKRRDILRGVMDLFVEDLEKSEGCDGCDDNAHRPKVVEKSPEEEAEEEAVVEELDISNKTAKNLVRQSLREAFSRTDEDDDKRILNKSVMERELEMRKLTIDKHPLYNIESFRHHDDIDDAAARTAFNLWRTKEENEITKLMAKFSVKEKETPYNAILILRLLRARDLTGKDKSGLSDPYAIVDLNNQSFMTQIVDQDLNPIWDEEMSFEVTSPNDVLKINLWDKDPESSRLGKMFKGKGRDDFLGRKEFRCGDIPTNVESERWYDLEKRSERSHISGQIRLGFHYIFDDPTDVALPAYHKDYRRLAFGLAARKNLSAKGDGISPEYWWMLEEFADRFGVDHDWQKAVQLEVCAITLARRAMDISLILEAVLSAKKLHQIKRFCKAAEDKYIASGKALLSLCADRLMAYRILYPDGENAHEGKLQDLVSLYIELQDFTCESHDLPQLIKAGLESRYMMIRAEAEPMIPESLSVTLAVVCASLKKEAEELISNFAIGFNDHVDFVDLTIRTFHFHLIEEIMEHMNGVKDTDLPGALKLFSEFRSLLDRWYCLVPDLPRTDLGNIFNPCVLFWVESLARQSEDWVQQAYKADRFRPISDDKPHSTSVIDIFCGLAQNVQFLKSLDYPCPLNNWIFFRNIATIVGLNMKDYCELIAHDLTTINESIKKAEKFAEKHGCEAPENMVYSMSSSSASLMDDDDEVNLSLRQQFLVRLNCVIAGRSQLYDFLESIEDYLAASFEEAQRDPAIDTSTLEDTTFEVVSCANTGSVALRQTLDQGIRLLSSGMTAKFAEAFEGFSDPVFSMHLHKKSKFGGKKAAPLPPTPADKEVNDHLSPLTIYLNKVLAEVSTMFYFDEGLQRLLGELWGATKNAVRVVLVGDRPGHPPKPLDRRQFLSLKKAVDIIANFLVADGDGLPKSYITNRSPVFDELLKTYYDVVVQEMERQALGSDYSADDDPTTLDYEDLMPLYQEASKSGDDKSTCLEPWYILSMIEMIGPKKDRKWAKKEASLVAKSMR